MCVCVSPKCRKLTEAANGPECIKAPVDNIVYSCQHGGLWYTHCYIHIYLYVILSIDDELVCGNAGRLQVLLNTSHVY